MLKRPVHSEEQPASCADVSSVPRERFARQEDAAWPRILPFALFMAFIMLNALLQGLGTVVPALAPLCNVLPLWLYPVRIAVVLAALIYAWPAYRELKGRIFAHGGEMLLAVGGASSSIWLGFEWHGHG